MHVFLAPHLDDVALSCGGWVSQLVRGGAGARIATLCTADAPAGRPATANATRVHGSWGLGPQPYAQRREEDRQACARLGAQPVHLGLLDVIYRVDAAGDALYQRNYIGGDVHARDWAVTLPAAVRVLGTCAVAGTTTLVAPLGLGGHVDHVIARRAAEQVAASRGLALVYYEDFPYGERDYALRSPAIAGLDSELVALAEADLRARIAAVCCYSSQLRAVFKPAGGDAADDTAAARIRAYAAAIGGERYWLHAG